MGDALVLLSWVMMLLVFMGSASDTSFIGYWPREYRLFVLKFCCMVMLAGFYFSCAGVLLKNPWL